MLMLHQLFRATIKLFIYTLPFWFIFRVYILNYRKKTGHTASHEVFLFLCYAYLLTVFALTLYPLPLTRHNYMYGVNLMPVINTFNELISSLKTENHFIIGHSLVNIMGNLALFFPVGILLPVWRPTFDSFKNIALVAFCASVTIESIQYLSHFVGNYRNTDVDDVILNTSGAVMGYGLYKLCLTMFPADKQRQIS